MELKAQRLPELLLGDEPEPYHDLADRLLPSPLLGQGRRELLGGERPGLDQQITDLGAPLVALEHRRELAAGDDSLADQDVAEGHIGLGQPLPAQRFLHLVGRREPLGDQDVAEPQAAGEAARRAVARGRTELLDVGRGPGFH